MTQRHFDLRFESCSICDDHRECAEIRALGDCLENRPATICKSCLENVLNAWSSNYLDKKTPQ